MKDPKGEQPAVEDLRNALTIALMGRDGYIEHAERLQAFKDIARLIEHALPSLVAPVKS